MPSAELVEEQQTPYQSVSVARLPGQTVFLSNGSIVASTADEPEHIVTAAMLTAQRPHANSALVIGVGTEGLVPILLRYPFERIDLVTVDEMFHDVVVRHQTQAVQEVFSDHRVNVHFVDPREFLSAREKDGLAGAYDVVFVDFPGPDTAYLNRFYTVDFYRMVHRALSERGVLATRILAGENFAGTELMLFGRSVFRSLEAVFDDVVVTPGEHAWLFASPSHGVVTLDSAELAERFQSQSTRDESVVAEVFANVVPVERVDETLALFTHTGDLDPNTLINSDARPVTLFLSLLMLGEQTGAGLGRPLRAVRSVGLSLFLFPLLALLVLRLYFRASTRSQGQAQAFNGTVLLAVLGAVSMCLSIMLLIAFQNRFGHLFISIGLLSALFMLGLAVGGLGGARLLRKVSERRFWPAHVVSLPVIVLCLTIPHLLSLLTDLPTTPAKVIYHVLFLGTGALCGTAFPVAGFFVERAHKKSGKVAGRLESADHWGGAIGAAIVGVLAIPTLGITVTGIFLGLLVAGVWLLFIAEQLGTSGTLARIPGWGGLADRLEKSRRRHRKSHGRTVGFAIAATIVIVVIASSLLSNAMSVPKVHLDPQWLLNRYHALNLQVEDDPFVHYRIEIEQNEEQRAIVAASRAIAPDVEGYGGPINLLLVVDDEGWFREVSLLESRETPTYTSGIDSWLEEFSGWPLDQPIVVGDGVDVITGATVTSNAVVDILEQSRVRLAVDVLDTPVPARQSSSVLARFGAPTVYIIMALFAVVPLGLRQRPRRQERNAFLLFNLIGAGFLFNLQFSLIHVTRLVFDGLPSPYVLDLFLLTIGVLFLSALFGQIYCGYLCPFGALQELLGKLGLTRKASLKTEQGARWVKFGILAFVLFVFAFNRSASILEVDPLLAIFGFDYSTAMALLLCVIGVCCLYYFRFWCRYLCPVGAFFALFNKLALARRWTKQKSYRACHLGVRNQWEIDCLQCHCCVTADSKQPALETPATGEKESSPAERPKWMGVRGSDVGLLLGMVAVVFLLFVGSVGSPRVAESMGETRDVDVEEIRRQIDEQWLSDHEALYWQSIDDADDGEADENGSSPLY